MMLALPFEIWRDVVWYDWRYKVSNMWNIISTVYWKNRIMRQSYNSSWYKHINLQYKWKIKTICCHRVVLETFKWTNKLLQCNHIDWNKDNNNVNNLERCTAKENINHSFKVLWRKPSCTALWVTWILNKKSIPIIVIDKSWNENIYYWIRDAARTLWLNCAHIWECLRWNRKSHWWYKYKHYISS